MYREGWSGWNDAGYIAGSSLPKLLENLNLLAHWLP